MEDLGPLFQPPSDPDHFWILVVLLAAPAIASCLYVLVRGQLPLLLSATMLLLVPAFAYVLGDLHMLEGSKKTEFCGSCHETMSPLLTSMQVDDSTLAGWHFRRGAVNHETACYECHSGYGIWGTASAKLAGVNHMIKTVTGNYEFPLEKHGTFDIDSCRGCHAAAVPFRAVDSHRDPDLQQLLLSGEMSCAGTCHPAAHPDEALMGASAASVTAR
jgi:hypothetical protein